MRNNFLLAVGLLPIFCGCMMWDAGYTENRDQARFSVQESDKIPITYSIDFVSENGQSGELAKAMGVREKVEDALKATGLFSDVCYGSKGGVDSYHVDFKFRVIPTPQDAMFGIVFFSEISLCLIPTGFVEPVDASAVLYLQDKAIYSTAKAEELRYLVWLPTLPVGMVMNSWTVTSAIMRGSINAMVADIASEHCRRFMKDTKVERIDDDDLTLSRSRQSP